MNTPAIFNHPSFGKLRTWTNPETGEPWFVARDIAAALGYTNPLKAIREHCKGVNKTCIPSTKGLQQTNIIPEDDLYRLITRSKLPAAKRFESWVFGEVLPQIRKTGGYIPIQAEDDETLILSKALAIMKRTIDQKEQLISNQRRLIDEQADNIQAMQPKVAVYDAHVAPDGLITAYEFARTLDGVNSIAFPSDMAFLGYFYKGRFGHYRVRGKYRGVYFAEKYAPNYGAPTIHMLDKGKLLVTRLYQENKLTMKKIPSPCNTPQ